MAFHEIISFSATAPGAAGVAATALSGDTLAAKNATPGSKILVLNMWSDFQAVGFVQVVAPSFNDTTRGIRSVTNIGNFGPLLPFAAPQYINPQELLSATIAGSATAGDVEEASIMMYYEDLPGQQGRYLNADDIWTRGVRQVTVQDSITTTAGPAYSGARALNAASDLLRANTDYALLGATIRTECLTLGIRAPDWSNGRVGIPGMAGRPDVTGSWFEMLSFETGLSLIPVFNSANKTAIFIDAAQDENATAVPFALNLVELAPG